MSGTSGSVMFLLRRCVAVRRLPLLTAAARSCSGLPSVRWSSETRTDLLRTAWQLQSAARCSQHGFCTKAGPPCDEEYPPLPAYQPESEPGSKEVYIVQVKGLPWSCTDQDLLHFFSECRIRDGERGVHLTSDQLGRPTGQAFLELEHEADVAKALEKHLQYLGPRYVQVFEVTNREAEEILKSSGGSGDGVVLLRGLPFSCREEDIRLFFSGLDIEENGITMVTDSRGRKSGRAFVQFSSQEEADKALQKNRELMGHRYVEVFPSSRSSVRSSFTPQQQASSRTGPDPQTDSQRAAGSPRSSEASVHYVHVRGLPYQVSVEEIVEFFSPLIVSKIVVECGSNGRPSGEADIYFSNHRDAVSAMSRDRRNLGHRYLELFLNSELKSD